MTGTQNASIEALQTLVTLAQGSGLALAANESHIGQIGGHIATATATMTRPADTTAYVSGDLIANSTTAGSVAPLTLAVARAANKSGAIRRLRLKVNDTAWLNASVRVHLYRQSPTVANGDNGAFSSTESNHIGYSDITLDRQFSDPCVKGIGIPAIGSEFNFEPDAGTANIYALLECRSAVTPAASKTFTLTLEAYQN
jgi:hypothetical protein